MRHAIFLAMVLVTLRASAAGKTTPPPAGDLIRIGADAPAQVPDAAAQARAEKMINDVFAKEYANKQQAARAQFAARLLEQAMQTEDDSAARYVLLREARDVGSLACEVGVVTRAMARMESQYRVESVDVILAAMVNANRAATNPKSAAAVAQASLLAADRIAARDQFDLAGKLCSVAHGAAERAQDKLLLQHAQAKEREIATLAETFATVTKTRTSLAQKPDDADANALVGTYICLVKDDFATGLPLLARGPDSPLRAAAQADLAEPDEPSRELELADRYWELSRSEFGLKRDRLQMRAGYWYRRCVGSLQGIHRTAAEGRIAAIDNDWLRGQGLEPGLRAELFGALDFTQPLKKRIDPALDFDWGLGAPDPAMPHDKFSVRWTGMLRIPRTGHMEFTAVANTGAKLWLDGKLVVDGLDLTRSRNGKTAMIDAAATLVPIRVDYWDTTGTARIHILWRPAEP